MNVSIVFKRGSIKYIVVLGLLAEVAILVLLTGVMVNWQPAAAKSVLLGAMAYFIPNTYFVLNAFRYARAPLETWVVRSFYRGHTGKLALSAMAFALVFYFHRDLYYGAMFLGFIFMILVNIWVTNRVATTLIKLLNERQVAQQS